MYRFKLESIVASCIGARAKVKSVEHVLSWSLDYKQVLLPLPFDCSDISSREEKYTACMSHKYASSLRYDDAFFCSARYPSLLGGQQKHQMTCPHETYAVTDSGNQTPELFNFEFIAESTQPHGSCHRNIHWLKFKTKGHPICLNR